MTDRLLAWRPLATLCLSLALVAGTGLVQPAQAAHTLNAPLKPVAQQLGSMVGLMGVELAARGQLLAAEPLLAQALAITPKDTELLVVYGMVLDGLDRQEQTQAVWQRVVALDPGNVQAYYGMARLAERQKAFDQAIEALNKAIALSPNNAQLHYDLGVLYATLEQFAPSAHHTHEAIELGLKTAESLNNYGYALAHTGQFTEAHKAVDQSLALAPDSAATLDSKGFIYSQQKQWSQALLWYDKALAQDPTIGEIYYHKALVYEALKQIPLALSAYQTYLQLEPDAKNKAEVTARIAQLSQRPATLSPKGKSAPPTLTNGSPKGTPQ